MTKSLLMKGMYAKFLMINMLTLRRILALKMKRMILHSTRMLNILLITTHKIPFNLMLSMKSKSIKNLKKLTPKKQLRPDDIPPKLVKLGSPVLAPIITKVINYGITTSNFPSSLKMANVSPVYKKK